MNERDLLIWAAGFFDGKGCVNIGKCTVNRENSKGKRTYTSYQLSIIAAQKTKPCLEIFIQLFGGTITSQLHQEKFMVWKWKATGPQAANALIKMLPYLQVKRAAAEIGLRCYELSASWLANHRRTELYPPEIREAQDLCHTELRMLNTPEDFVPALKEKIQ